MFQGTYTRWCGCACLRRVVLLVCGIAMCHGRADVAGLVEKAAPTVGEPEENEAEI